jgi:hypothetical protein
MPFELTDRAIDRKLYVIPVGFLDHNGDPVPPKTAVWTLTDGRGNVINSRQNVAVSPLVATVDIALFGEDTAYQLAAERIFTVEYTYDSDLGNDLPAGDQARFEIDNLVAIT